MGDSFIVPTSDGRFVSLPNKTAESRERIRKSGTVRNAYSKHNVRKNRSRVFQPAISNGMSEDIPTSGEGWTLK